MIFNPILCAALDNKDEKILIEQLQPLVKKLSRTNNNFREDLTQELNIEIIKAYRKSIPLINHKYDVFVSQLI
ncbi:hypothetical protein KII95_07960 [Leuconostoc gelidum subsp. aenigmaticum]|uniref:hypothetical protein n=1 Tax=Leuconostoc gelidum TaxID=1244 RepID=UPI001CC530A8|nr:hypothetical protein [Leuconostoc gelidum]MBZ6003947.1 hypothetical protein [Leuconostoc gelidum subsp. aenigmaticum]